MDGPPTRPPGSGLALLPLAAALAFVLALAAVVTPGPAGFRALLPLEVVPRISDALPWGERVVHPDVLQREALDGLVGGLALLLLAGWCVALVTAATLLAAEGTLVRSSLAVRGALGAAPLRLLREQARAMAVPLLRRGLLLGGALGFVVAWALRSTWPHRGAASPPDVPPLAGATAAALVVATLLLAAFMALLATRYGFRDLPDTLAAGGRATAGRAEGGLRRIAATLQLTACLVLLSAGALVLRGWGPAAPEGGADPGGREARVLLLSFDAPEGEDAAARSERYEALLERLSRVGTLRAESIASPGAWSGLGSVDFVLADCGRCVRGGLPIPLVGEYAAHHLVTPGFFEAAGIAAAAGRLLDDGDGPNAPRVALVSRSFALANFERGNPLGRHVRVTRGTAWHEVVGVVEDRRVRALGRGGGREPAVYLSALQHPPERGDVAVIAEDRPGDAEAALADALGSAGLAPAGPPEPAAERARRQEAPLVWAGAVMAAVALASLALAFLGILRASRLEVAARRRELAVRAALGASPGRLRRLTAWRAARLALLAALLALPPTVAVGARLRELAGEVPLFQPGVYLLLGAALAATALAGALSAAAHAARTPPADSLADARARPPRS